MMRQFKNHSAVAWMWIPVLFLFMLPAALQAGEVTLAWDPNSESNLAGYRLYYDGDSDSEMYAGTGANEGDSPVVIYLEDLSDSDIPMFTLTGLEDGQYYYFALTAFDADGLESDFSEEVGTLIGTESAEDTDSSSEDTESSSEDTESSSEDTESSSEDTESDYNKVVADAANESTESSEKSGGSGGCFISGAMDGGAGGMVLAGMVALLLSGIIPRRDCPGRGKPPH